MPRVSKGEFKNLTNTSGDIDTGIRAWDSGNATISVQGDMGGGTLYLYVALDTSEETKSNFARYTDGSGTVLSLSGPTSYSLMKSIVASLPTCNWFLRVTGGTNVDCDVRMTRNT